MSGICYASGCVPLPLLLVQTCAHAARSQGHTPPPWPELLRLYSRLSQFKTVHEWLESASSSYSRSHPSTPSAKSPTGVSPDVLSSIDPRRLISFGVIKGFVRRVRRWPVLLSRRGRRIAGRMLSGEQVEGIRSAFQEPSNRGYPLPHGDEGASVGTIRAGSGGSGGYRDLGERTSGGHNVERTSGGHHGERDKGTNTGNVSTASASALSTSMGTLSASLSPPTARSSAHTLLTRVAAASGVPNASGGAEGGSEGLSNGSGHGTAAVPVPTPTPASTSGTTTALSTSPVAPRAPRTTPTQPNQISRARPALGERERSDSTSTAITALHHPNGGRDPGFESIPPELEALLDGTHHADELCVRYGVSWQILERWLSLVGGGNGTADDMGRVRVIYR